MSYLSFQEYPKEAFSAPYFLSHNYADDISDVISHPKLRWYKDPNLNQVTL